MLKYILPLLLLLPFIGIAQSDSINNEKWEKVETMPEFPGGQNELFKYLGSNIKYPIECKSAGIQGKVYVNFIINPNGSRDSVIIEQGVHPLLDKEAIRVINAMPLWKPGTIDGKPVSVKYSLPISFIVKNGTFTPTNNRDKGIKNFKEGDYKNAIYYLSKIIKVNKSDANLFYYRGMSYHKDGNTKKAIKDLEKAKELGSKEAEEYLKTINN